MHPLIPAPLRRETSRGHCPATRRWRIRTAPGGGLADTAATLRLLMAPHLAAAAAPAEPGSPPGTIELALGPAPDGPEGYRLLVEADRIHCQGESPAGVFRAAMTAAQLLACTPQGERLPCQRIEDAPRYGWRGLLLDPARHFLTPAELRGLIDLAALYKLNVLHLHLTDHEGWRLEIPGRPALTADRGQPSYSVREYLALQRYAEARHITVVPEIDLPGHCAAALRAYPELPTLPRPAGLDPRFPFNPPLDPRAPAARTFITEVLGEVARLTSGPFVHFGADEAVGADPESFGEAVRLARQVLRAAGKRPVGWQESSRAGFTAEDIGQFWVDPEMMDLPRGEAELRDRPDLLAAGYTPALLAALTRFFAPTAADLGRMAEGGGQVILSPQSHLYLDRPYRPEAAPPEQAAEARRLGFAYRPEDVRHTAGWNPADYPVAPARIAGVEATLFAESLDSVADLHFLLLPRLASVAEAAWCGRPAAWPEYRERLAGHAALWRQRGISALRSREVDWR